MIHERRSCVLSRIGSRATARISGLIVRVDETEAEVDFVFSAQREPHAKATCRGAIDRGIRGRTGPGKNNSGFATRNTHSLAAYQTA
jgi:hypothetical protein